MPLKSSTIEAAGYHEESQTLHVVFRGGGHYIYNKVPPNLYRRFMLAKSHGKFLHQYIKGRHQHAKID